jgi:O-antigen ligase
LLLPALTAATGLGVAAAIVAVDRARPSATPFVLVPFAAVFIAVIVGNLRRLLLAAVLLDIPLQWDINLHWRPDIATLGANAGLNISVTTVALTGLYALWFAELLSRSAPVDRRRFVIQPAVPLLVYVAVTAASYAVATDRQLTMFEVVLLAQMLLLFIYLVSTVTTREDIRFVALMLVSGLAIESVLSIGFYLTGSTGGAFGLSGHLQNATSGTVDRSGGTIGSANAAGSYLAAAVTVTAGTLALRLGHVMRNVALGTAALGLVALVTTLSRGGWLSLAVGMGMLVIVGVLRGHLRPGHVVAGAALFGLVALALHGPILDRLTGNDGGSAAGRVPLLYLASDMIRAHPLTGIGGNNFAVAIPSYAGPDFSQDWLYVVHNRYLLTWAEAGLGALLAWLWFLGASLRLGWRTVRSDGGDLAVLAAALTAAIVGQMADMLIEPYQGRAQTELLIVLVALLIGVAGIAKRHPVTTSPFPSSPDTGPGSARTWR